MGGTFVPEIAQERGVVSTVIVAAARTAFGKVNGSLSTLAVYELGAVAIRAAVLRSGLKSDQITEVIMGQVIQAGTGQSASRKAAILAGIGMDVPASSVNKVCLSGMDAIAIGHYLINSDPTQVVVAGGMESMSNAPYVLPKGANLEQEQLIDTLFHDALICTLDGLSMGTATDKFNQRYDLSRAVQDDLAAKSQQRAAAATSAGLFKSEIAEIKTVNKVVDVDEGIRGNTTTETLANLKTVFLENGTVTAGNASQITDGAVALVLMSKDQAETHGIKYLAEIISHASVAGPDTSLHEQPANAIQSALTKAKLNVADIDLFEINEAFAAVSAVSMQKLGVADSIVNVNGGAIALGHPVGASGARIVMTLAYELARRGGGIGAAGICGGTGQGEALIIKV
jgi:acetyl-CoA C-acetyltransferase